MVPFNDDHHDVDVDVDDDYESVGRSQKTDSDRQRSTVACCGRQHCRGFPLARRDGFCLLAAIEAIIKT